MRMRETGRFVAIVAIALTGTIVHAAPPESVPPECRAQVTNALRLLEPAFAGKTRRVQASNKGSVELAIASYAPPRLHPVDEGTLPPVRADGRCPPEMASFASRFCVDKYEGSLVERLPDGTTRPHSPYLTPATAEGHVYVARSVANVVPQGYISAAQAQGACKAAGKRLCQAVEWRAACG
jgi:hypothetical protein